MFSPLNVIASIGLLRKKSKGILLNLLKVFALCTLAVLTAMLFKQFKLGNETLLIIFLIGLLICAAITHGYTYVLIASVCSVCLFNFFFTHPLHTFIISDRQDVFLLVFFLIVALISGYFSSRSYKQATIARENETNTRILYEIIESFLNATGTQNIVENGMRYISKYTGYNCKVTLYATKNKGSVNVYQTQGYKPGTHAQYTLPIRGIEGQLGIISFSNVPMPPNEKAQILASSIVHQMAAVLDREFINTQRIESELAAESERIKSVLLRSISHDIRTPLTGILGASDTILQNYSLLDEAEIKKLAGDINEECGRLISTVQNILDMTRISEGKLTVKKEYEAVDDIVGQVVARAWFLTRENRLKVVLPKDIVLVPVDGKLFVQVLFNLLDNAYKHCKSDVCVQLSVYTAAENVVFEVSDDGDGIDENLRNELFECFVTMPQNAQDKGRGVGLGLCICKMIVDVHGGTISAHNKPEGGAVFTVTLPAVDETEEDTRKKA